MSKKNILVIQGDWKSKIGKDTHKNWGSTSEKLCNSRFM